MGTKIKKFEEFILNESKFDQYITMASDFNEDDYDKSMEKQAKYIAKLLNEDLEDIVSFDWDWGKPLFDAFSKKLGIKFGPKDLTWGAETDINDKVKIFKKEYKKDDNYYLIYEYNGKKIIYTEIDDRAVASIWLSEKLFNEIMSLNK